MRILPFLSVYDRIKQIKDVYCHYHYKITPFSFCFFIIIAQ